MPAGLGVGQDHIPWLPFLTNTPKPIRYIWTKMAVPGVVCATWNLRTRQLELARLELELAHLELALAHPPTGTRAHTGRRPSCATRAAAMWLIFGDTLGVFCSWKYS
eukprot:COSAG05_NODE_253_length_12854_cov_23.790200_8_plen_107_part_00